MQPDDLVGLFCANMDAFPNVVAILVKLIFMTPDWTKLHNLLVLEKCLDYTWLQFKENETSTIFTNIESVLRHPFVISFTIVTLSASRSTRLSGTR